MTTKEPVLATSAYLTAFGGLHNIKGNHAPYFTLTGEIRNSRGVVESCGCLHDEILKRWPKFADLAALHLSDIDGIPMYAVENGWYHFTKDLKVFADYMRITLAEATCLQESLTDKALFAQWVETQETRWKTEADACVAKHNLVVFGDPGWTKVA